MGVQISVVPANAESIPCLCVHSFNNDLLSIYCEPDIMLSSRDLTKSKILKSCFWLPGIFRPAGRHKQGTGLEGLRKVFIETRTFPRWEERGQALWAEATGGTFREVWRGEREVQGTKRSLECGAGNTRLRKTTHLVVAPISLLFNMQTFPPFQPPTPF